jgi:hypothetical protein
MSLDSAAQGRNERQCAVIAGHEVFELLRALHDRSDEPGFELDPKLERRLLGLLRSIRYQLYAQAQTEWYALRKRWAFLGG